MDFEIRRLKGEEIQAAVDVWVRARWNAQPRLEERMGYTDDQNLAFFRDVVAMEHQVWLALQGDKVLGLMALSDGEIDQLHIDPEHQNHGVGSALLKKARELYPEGLGLFTHQRNETARRFYERKGFVAVRFGVSPHPESEPDVRYEWKRAQHPSPAA
jgi:ribosomal protein S18 acetylase RimI-like enzyme